MCELTKSNFKEKLADIKTSLQNAKLISIDLEFSALQPMQSPRLFDNNTERYAKLRQNLMDVVPVQVGITAFQFDNKTNNYCGDVFTFYVVPPSFGIINKHFYFEASTMQFLALHNFDFNKFAFMGIPYLNNEEEALVRQQLASGDFSGETSQMHCEFENLIDIITPIVSKWYNNCNIGDFLEIPNLEKYIHCDELMYCIHKHIRQRYDNVWTYTDQNFTIKKVTSEELETLAKKHNLEQQVLDDLIGFRQVFDILTSLKKPILGHNVLQDLVIMVNNFHSRLPESYTHFKQLVHHLFPVIFDTKTLYYELRQMIPKEKLPEDTSLQCLYYYFKDGSGRHLVTNSTAIEYNVEEKKVGCFHDAGWDSYCTGYVFLRLAHYNIAGNYPKNKTFACTELISGLLGYKNRVNIIRGASTHIQIDGEDPSSTRPPWLIVESLKNEPLDVHDLMSTLSSYGCVDIKKISSKGNRVLVAVDNYRTAREISRTFTTNPKFQVRHYNTLKHSSLAQAAILGAITISGTILLWLTHKMTKK